MTKKDINWAGLIKVKIDERKKSGEKVGIKEVIPAARKDWDLINGKTLLNPP